ncbi:hypothetical protein AB0C29_24585 [Actinoplanes sp. NPDC048791]|uniref:hypothetical protein n=1 Tax=Actinoplanes sp. NPDC048791 TaxID=3154623 RepID=UPI0034001AA9
MTWEESFRPQFGVESVDQASVTGASFEVVEMARTGVARIASEELPLFDSVAQAWLAGKIGRRADRRRPPGGTARIGIPSELDIQLVFDVIAGTLATVLGEAGYAGLRGRRWPRRRSRPQPRVMIDPGQQAELHATCVAHAQELGLSKRKAVLLADSVFGPRPGDVS